MDDKDKIEKYLEKLKDANPSDKLFKYNFKDIELIKSFLNVYMKEL